MRFLIKLLGPAALLALASINASAAPVACSTLAGASLSAYQTAGSCGIGNLTFSNFQFEYSTNVSQGSAVVPDPTSSTFLTISSSNDGTCDPNGTCSDENNTLYQLITDFSGDGNTTGSGSVEFNQSEALAIQFSVTESNLTKYISEIDGAGTAAVSVAGDGTAFYEKDICYGQGFNANTDAHPVVLNGKCANNTFPNSTPVQVQMDTNTGRPLSDPTQFSNMDTEANGALYSSGTLGNTFGVYDLTTLSGGSVSNGFATMVATGAQENDFLESTNSGTPEPGTFVLLGGALVGLGALRRRKKSA